MSKPSLNDFMAPPPVQTKQPKAASTSEEIKGITIRLTRSQWLNMIAMTAADGTKIQPYILGLVQADFDRRGLRL